MEEKKKMENDYKKALGVWTHELDGIKHNLVPNKQDNLNFLDAKERAAKQKSEKVLYASVAEIYVGMVLRAYPDLKNDTENLEALKEWVGVNINKIAEDLMVALKWTTPDDIEKIKEKQLGNPQPL